jgi:hypothetical protein
MEDLKKAYLTSTIVNSAIIASLVVYVVVAEMIKAQYEPFEGFVKGFDLPPLRYALYVLALVQLMVMIKIRGILLRKISFDGPEEAISRLSRTSLITSALCEAPAIFGLVLYLLGGLSRDFYVLLAWSGFLFFLYFPRYSNWESWVKSARRT